MKTISHPISRREAIKAGAIAAPPSPLFPVMSWAAQAKPARRNSTSPAIGVGGMGSGDVRLVRQAENIVALCDPDRARWPTTPKKFPRAKLYTDFRKMLETQKDIDAVTIATPDHVHAVATRWP